MYFAGLGLGLVAGSLTFGANPLAVVGSGLAGFFGGGILNMDRTREAIKEAYKKAKFYWEVPLSPPKPKAHPVQKSSLKAIEEAPLIHMHDTRLTDTLFQHLGKDAAALAGTCRQFREQGEIHSVLAEIMHLLQQPSHNSEYASQEITKLLLNISMDEAIAFAGQRPDLLILCAQKLATSHSKSPRLALQFIFGTVRNKLSAEEFRKFILNNFSKISPMVDAAVCKSPADKAWVMEQLENLIDEAPVLKLLLAVQLGETDLERAIALITEIGGGPNALWAEFSEKLVNYDLDKLIRVWRLMGEGFAAETFFDPFIKKHAFSKKVDRWIVEIGNLMPDIKDFIVGSLRLKVAEEIYFVQTDRAEAIIRQVQKSGQFNQQSSSIGRMFVRLGTKCAKQDPARAHSLFNKAVHLALDSFAILDVLEALIKADSKQFNGLINHLTEAFLAFEECFNFDHRIASFVSLVADRLTQEQLEKRVLDGGRELTAIALATHYPDLANKVAKETLKKDAPDFVGRQVRFIAAFNPEWAFAIAPSSIDPNVCVVHPGIAQAPKAFWQDARNVRRLITASKKHRKGPVSNEIRLLMLLKVAEAHPDQRLVRNVLQGKPVRK